MKVDRDRWNLVNPFIWLGDIKSFEEIFQLNMILMSEIQNTTIDFN